jgi:selenocysteine lyase/cysteine desulfurase
MASAVSVAHVERESLDAAESAFRRDHPRYADTGILDELRCSEFARLDRGDHAYLDYAGGGQFAECQLADHMQLLRGNVFGNPHSVNPTSALSTELAERARAYVLNFFRASPDEYVAIFTPNATGALRLVGEAYPFHHGDRFLLMFDNHNSVNGIREFARARGAETTYIPSVARDLQVDEDLLPRYLTDTFCNHRGRRGRVHDLARHASRRRVLRGNDPGRLRPSDRAALGWSDPRLARPCNELCRRASFHGLRR